MDAVPVGPVPVGPEAMEPVSTSGSGPAESSGAALGLSLPTTGLAAKALDLITHAQEPYLRNHSVRSFLFGRAAAEQGGRRADEDYDAEVVFLICVLHDMGLVDQAQAGRRFEVDGADFAARFLEENGVTDGRVDTVWEAIALHTSTGLRDSPVHRRRRPAEIGVAQNGIFVDVIGGPGGLPPGYAETVLTAHPRLGGTRALTDAIVANALTDPERKALPMTLPGELVRQNRPDLPYLTWDTITGMSGWDD